MAGQYEKPRRKKSQAQEPGEMEPRPKPRRKKRRRINWVRFVTVVLVALLIIVGGAACAARAYYRGEVDGSRRPEGEIEVDIPMGSGTARIASILKEEGVIGNSFLFRWYSRKVEADGSFQYGSFTLDPSEGYDGIIRRLQEVQQKLESVRVTFPEGINAFQIGESLENAGLCSQKDFLDALQNHLFPVDFIGSVSQDPRKLVRLDGFLFPDTYEFFSDESVDSIILRMLENFQDKVLTMENQAALQDAGYSLDQLVSLAAIIQKESFSTEEMYNVSSVFSNRLADDSPYPKLESNTTNDFISDFLTPYFDGEPPQDMIDAYDSYNQEGIPIGAICNPGLEAIVAALHPERNTLDGTYYFFVTDVEYNYYYGKTFQQHLDNIETAKAVNRNYGIEGLVQ